jgi:hypothetical protein
MRTATVAIEASCLSRFFLPMTCFFLARPAFSALRPPKASAYHERGTPFLVGLFRKRPPLRVQASGRLLTFKTIGRAELISNAGMRRFLLLQCELGMNTCGLACVDACGGLWPSFCPQSYAHPGLDDRSIAEVLLLAINALTDEKIRQSRSCRALPWVGVDP